MKFSWYDKNPGGYAHGWFNAENKQEALKLAMNEIGLIEGETVYFWYDNKGIPYYAEHTIQVNPLIENHKDLNDFFEHYGKSHREFIEFAKKKSGVEFTDSEISRYRSGDVSLSKGIRLSFVDFFSNCG